VRINRLPRSTTMYVDRGREPRRLGQRSARAGIIEDVPNARACCAGATVIEMTSVTRIALALVARQRAIRSSHS
jgi:hypothetical protein